DSALHSFRRVAHSSAQRVPLRHGGVGHRHPGPLSAFGVTLDSVDMLAEAVAKVPNENLRVAGAEFGALWSFAEKLAGRPGPDPDYLVGALLTCRWLASQPVWSPVTKRAEMPYAPVTWRRHAAMPETIDAEYLAAVSSRAPEPEIARGVVA